MFHSKSISQFADEPFSEYSRQSSESLQVEDLSTFFRPGTLLPLSDPKCTLPCSVYKGPHVFSSCLDDVLGEGEPRLPG